MRHLHADPEVALEVGDVLANRVDVDHQREMNDAGQAQIVDAVGPQRGLELLGRQVAEVGNLSGLVAHEHAHKLFGALRESCHQLLLRLLLRAVREMTEMVLVRAFA